MSVMRARQYAAVGIASSVAGALWGTVLVDFEPGWYDDLPRFVAALILLLPLIAHFCCAFLFRWWRGTACLIYTGLVLAWWVGGAVSNEMAHVGNLTHFCPVPLLLFHLLGAALTVLSWLVGRWVHRVVFRVG